MNSVKNIAITLWSYVRYYHKHALVALIIALVIGAISYFAPYQYVLCGAIAGAFFYIGREIRDYEKLNEGMDWKGLLWPVLTMMIIYSGVIYGIRL